MAHLFKFIFVQSSCFYKPHVPASTIHLSLKNISWPWNGVAINVLVDVDHDSWVALAICSRKAYSAQACCPTASHLQLVTRHIELGAARCRGGVQSNDLSPQEVITRGKAGWDGEGALAAVVVERHGPPCLGRDVVAFFIDFKPDCTGAVSGLCVGDPTHVDDYRAKVVSADGLCGA